MRLTTTAWWIVTFCSSIVLGYASSVYSGDLWFGVAAAVIFGTILTGVINYFNIILNLMSRNSGLWESLFGIVTVLLLFIPSMSNILSASNMYILMIFLWSILICGVVIGIGIERNTANNTGRK